MSYPTGGSGYNAPQPTPSSVPGYGSQPAGAPAAGPGTSPVAGKGLPFFLTVGIAALGVINFLLGFAPYTGMEIGGLRSSDTTFSLFQNTGAATLVTLGLLAGLLAGLSLLPKQTANPGLVAAVSLASFLGILFSSFDLGEGMSLKWGGWVILFLAFVQAVVAVVALLFELGIMKAPYAETGCRAGWLRSAAVQHLRFAVPAAVVRSAGRIRSAAVVRSAGRAAVVRTAAVLWSAGPVLRSAARRIQHRFAADLWSAAAVLRSAARRLRSAVAVRSAAAAARRWHRRDPALRCAGAAPGAALRRRAGRRSGGRRHSRIPSGPGRQVISLLVSAASGVSPGAVLFARAPGCPSVDWLFRRA